MKILFTIFADINNFGGITADLELKCLGLTEAGHEVTLVGLRESNQVIRKRQTNLKGGPAGSYLSNFKSFRDWDPVIANTDMGWYNIPVIGYGSDEGIAKWKSVANKFDVIFHEIPGPNPPDDDGRWRQIYDVKTPQIIVVHDAHFRVMYPHIIEVAHKIKGITCTNPAGYNGLSWFPGLRSFIGAPHPVLDWDSQPSWDERRPVAVAAHMWKAWKHQDLLVRAAPSLKQSKLIMAGDGIERRYLTSETKCPPAFQGLWEAARSSGNFSYKGLVTPDKLFAIYQRSRVMVDMSWSDTFNELGNHFNRSIIEGYNNGVVPICVDMNMNEDGMPKKMFKPGVTHLEVSPGITPKQLARRIDEVANMSASEAEKIISAGRKVLLKYFDYRKCSLEFLKLAKQEPCGVYGELEMGKSNKIIKTACKMKLDKEPQPTIKAAVKRMIAETQK